VSPLLDLLLDTIRSLRAHALRFGLTSLGIVWGAFMLSYLSASMEGTDRHFVQALEKAGPKIVFMGGGSVFKARVGERGARPVVLKEEDAKRLHTLQGVVRASPSIDLWSEVVRSRRRTKLINVQGVSEQAEVIRNFHVGRGRFLSRLDVERGERVAFLGADAAERLFGRAPALGKPLQIDGVTFRVIGVAERKGAQLMDSTNPDDRKILIPYTTAQRWITHSDAIGQIIFEPVTRDASWSAIRRVREVTGLHHQFSPDVDMALWFFNVHEILSIVHGLLFALRVFLVVAGTTTLLVGAVGVMNIMLVVVAERTNEIGLRKAVGGTNRAIFLQFLAEATAVCGLSGLLGTALGVGFTQLIARLVPPDAPMASPPLLDPTTLVTLSSALVLVGVVAGVVPALRAARVPPSEALRAL
jgi:putative ABC transport system permease protein